MHSALSRILAESGAVARRDHPRLANAIDSASRRGEIVRVLPAVYVRSALAHDWRTLARAASVWNSDCVIVDEAAASLTFWRSRHPSAVTIAGVQARFHTDAFTVTRRVVPPELITTRAGIRISTPDLTAVDLAPASGGRSIDDALRARVATVGGMYDALNRTSGRRGHEERRRLLLDSRSEPWSSRERLAHRLLRDAGITQWRANVPIICDGYRFVQDIAMTDCPLVVEIDGMQHMDPSAWEYDLWRSNLLTLAGRTLLRFPRTRLTDSGEFVAAVRRGRELCGAANTPRR